MLKTAFAHCVKTLNFKLCYSMAFMGEQCVFNLKYCRMATEILLRRGFCAADKRLQKTAKTIAETKMEA
jgi:hypothetical protein